MNATSPPASRTISCAGGGVDRAAALQRHHPVEAAPRRPGTASTAIVPIARSRWRGLGQRVGRLARPSAGRRTRSRAARACRRAPRRSPSVAGRAARRRACAPLAARARPTPRSGPKSCTKPNTTSAIVGPVGDRDRDRVVRQPALGVERAVDRVDRPRAVPAPPKSTVPRSSLTAVKRAPSSCSALELGEDGVLGRARRSPACGRRPRRACRSRAPARRSSGASASIARSASAARRRQLQPVRSGADRASTGPILRRCLVPDPRPARGRRRTPAARCSSSAAPAPARRPCSCERFAWLAASGCAAGVASSR